MPRSTKKLFKSRNFTEVYQCRDCGFIRGKPPNFARFRVKRMCQLWASKPHVLRLVRFYQELHCRATLSWKDNRFTCLVSSWMLRKSRTFSLPPPLAFISLCFLRVMLPSQVVYAEPYYSRKDDVPRRPREFAGKVFRIPHKDDLPVRMLSLSLCDTLR